MTLKEKFRQELTGDVKTEIYLTNAEQIADDFAIGFAEWLVARELGFASFKLNDGVLEIYKKEKGL